MARRYSRSASKDVEREMRRYKKGKARSGKGGKLVLVTGSPGGSRIITTVANVIVNLVDYKMSLADAVAAPRIHHQWMPDEVRVEPDLPPDMSWLLERRGNKVVPAAPWGAAPSILVTEKNLQGVADTRAAGARAEGY
jgi:gamma-glutamyltranspeptidase/glutathione hydrolase